MKLVPEWKRCLRMFSVQAMVLGERYISPIIVDGTSLRHRIGSA